MTTSADALKLMLSTRRAYEAATATKVRLEREATENENFNPELVLDAGRKMLLASYAADKARDEYNTALRKEIGQ